MRSVYSRSSSQRGQSIDCGRFLGGGTEAKIKCSYSVSPAQRMDASIGRSNTFDVGAFFCMLPSPSRRTTWRAPCRPTPNRPVVLARRQVSGAAVVEGRDTLSPVTSTSVRHVLDMQKFTSRHDVEQWICRLDSDAHSTSVMGCGVLGKTDSVWADTPTVSRRASDGIRCQTSRRP